MLNRSLLIGAMLSVSTIALASAASQTVFLENNLFLLKQVAQRTECKINFSTAGVVHVKNCNITNTK